jgi:two-component system sensor histidine kinase AgrC
MVIFASLKGIDQANHWRYILLGLTLIIIWTLMVIIVFFVIVKVKEGRKINKIYTDYNPILERLIDETRTKQHDFKNHIQAIYSIAEMDKHTKIIKYIDDIILTSTKKNENFLNTNNGIISSLLFSKSCEMNSMGIEFEFKYDMPLPVYPLKDNEMVKVLCNLVDHARDATLFAENSNKKISITMKKKDHNKMIMITNTGIPISQEIISNILKKGYSTRSKNSGYKLYNVNKIIKKYGGKIEIVNSINMITVIVMLP